MNEGGTGCIVGISSISQWAALGPALRIQDFSRFLGNVLKMPASSIYFGPTELDSLV